MPENGKRKFSCKDIDKMQEILHNGDRVEIVPTKDGIRIFSVRRREQKSEDEEETDE